MTSHAMKLMSKNIFLLYQKMPPLKNQKYLTQDPDKIRAKSGQNLFESPNYKMSLKEVKIEEFD